MAFGDCLSGRYKGPCAVWDNETCRRVCKEEGRGRVERKSIFTMKGYLLFTILVLLAIGSEMAFGDCLSGRYKGPCAVWDNETCRRVCKEEGGGRVSGHCSSRLQCWCEGC
nr:unnamed protein product [Callosobruchus chinensis]